MNESFSAFVRVLTAALWGPHVLLLILLAGVWFTLRGRFMQVTKLPRMTRGALCGTQRCGGFSAFQSLTASLAGSLGTGNILGVAAAILVGGAGAVVWMWIAAFFGMMTVYAEGVLAAKFGTENAPGAIGYVQKAFGRHGAKIYAAGCVLSALGMGTMAQTGAASSVLAPMGVPRVLAGVVFAGLLLLCVRGGLPKAVRVTEKLVPFMAGMFLALCAAVLILRGSHIPGAVRNMLKGAFSLKAGAGGVCGMILAMREGISRGVFTNEAGLGSGTFATFRTENKTPEQIGTLGALQVFIDTILLCTITALCMLVSPVRDFSPEAALSVFSLVLGRFGELSAGVCVALFAFASVLAWSCYGMDALLYLLPKKGAAEKRIYMAFTALSCFLGCMSPFLGVLNVCDAFNGLMALLNVPALFVLTPQVFAKQIAQKSKKV